ncbi:hypothetical protein H9P43_001424 [Blastocladiella emersonii ATCC 22665]|nr:hypothetical protein H9P43_001424 [Blastocladiella emersonii ATCC 22665]
MAGSRNLGRRPSSPGTASFAALLFVLTLTLVAQALAATTYTVGNDRTANFATLSDAWASLVPLGQNATLQLLDGVHLLDVTRPARLNATAATQPFTITHVPRSGYTAAPAGAPPSTATAFSAVTISPSSTALADVVSAPLVQLLGPVTLQFQGMTLQGFAAPTSASSWAVFDLNGGSGLTLSEAVVRDGGVTGATFTVSARGTSTVRLAQTAIVSDQPLAMSLELGITESATLRVSDSLISSLRPWRSFHFTLAGTSTTLMTNCIVSSNRNMPFVVQDQATATFMDTNFVGNTSPVVSGLANLFLVSGASVNMVRCNVNGNYGGQTGIMTLLNAQGTFTDSVFSNNNGTSIMSFRVAGSSTANFTRCAIRNHRGTPRLFQLSETAKLSFDYSVFSNNAFGTSSAFYIGQGLQSELSNVTFFNNRAGSYMVVADRNSFLNLTRVTFDGNVPAAGGLVQTYGQSLRITDSVFANNAMPTMASTDRLVYTMGTVANAAFVIDGSQFVKNKVANLIAFANTAATNTITRSRLTGNEGVAVHAMDGTALTMAGSVVEGSKAPATASVLWLKGNASITDTEFTGNSGATRGGSILYSPLANSGSAINVAKSTFSNNTAGTDGGAIYLSPATSLSATIAGNRFTGNVAQRGGAVYVYSATQRIDMATNTFADNRAALGQGDNYASQPRRLRALVTQDEGSAAEMPQSVSLYSGDALPSVQVAALDQYDQVARTTADETFLLQAQVLGVAGGAASDSAVVPAVVTGEASKAILGASVPFQGLRFVGAPGTYTLGIMSLTDLYPSSVFNVTTTVVVSRCTAPRIEQPYVAGSTVAATGAGAVATGDTAAALAAGPTNLSVCQLPVCSKGCIEGQGTCVANDQCTCAAGFEGVDCALREGFNDAIEMHFRIVGTESTVASSFGATGALVAAARGEIPAPRTATASLGEDPTEFDIPILAPGHIHMEGDTAAVAAVASTGSSGGVSADLMRAIGDQVMAAVASLGLGTPVLRRLVADTDAMSVRASVSIQDAKGQYLELAALDPVARKVAEYFAANSALSASATSFNMANTTQVIRSSAALQWATSVVVNAPKLVVTFDSPLGIAVQVIFAICVLTTVLIMAVLTHYRATPVVRSSSYFFGMLISSGLLLGYLILPLSTGIPTSATCSAQSWVIGLSVAMVLGNLMTKNLRIMFIFGGSRKGRLIGLADRDMVKYSLAALLGEVVLLVLWTVMDAAVPVIIDTPTYRYWTCGSAARSGGSGGVFMILLVAYNAALLLLSVYLAIRTRGAQSAYRESKTIGIAVYTMTLVAGVAIPLLMMPTTGPVLAYAIKVAAVCTINLAVTFLLFYSKAYIAIFRPDLNNMEALNNRGTGFSRHSRSSRNHESSRRESQSLMTKQVMMSRRLTRQGESFTEIGSSAGSVSMSRGTMVGGSTGKIRTTSMSSTRHGGNMSSALAAAQAGGSRPALAASADYVSVPSSPTSIASPTSTTRLTAAATASDSSESPAAATVATTMRSLVASAVSRVRQGSNEPSPDAPGLTVLPTTGDVTTSRRPDALMEVDEESPAAIIGGVYVPSEPQRELFYVRSPRAMRTAFKQQWLHLYPLTGHLAISKAPVPVEAELLFLTHCRVRNLSHLLRNCFELEMHGQSYWVRTRQDKVFAQWYGWLLGICRQNEAAVDHEDAVAVSGAVFEGDEGRGRAGSTNIHASDGSTIAGSNAAMVKKSMQSVA